MKDEMVKWRVQTRLSTQDAWVNRGLYQTEDGAKAQRKRFVNGSVDASVSYHRYNVRVLRHEVKPRT